MKILAIETSCDETSAAVVTEDKQILSNIIASQVSEHEIYGGVVPEIAARAHVEKIDHVIKLALDRARVPLSGVDAIAVTGGPGLIGGVIVGVMVAKAIASVTKLPFIAVNHLEGHILSGMLCADIDFPYLTLLISGGHCQIIMAEELGVYHKIGSTIDDALGEAFDKVARMMNLNFPGGPEIEKMAVDGDPLRFVFPKPLKGREGCDFSFSGLKTSVRREIDKLGNLTKQDIKDISASFQHTIWEILADRLSNAIKIFRQHFPSSNNFVIGGGVASNKFIRSKLNDLLSSHNMNLIAPPAILCTDNAAMIGWAGIKRFKKGLLSSLDFEPKAVWPITNILL